MSLNNSQMLPDRIRDMRQMNDLINAEDIVLAEIEQKIDGMYQRTSLLRKELINERWLEEKLSQITDGIVYVRKKENLLYIEIVLNVGKLKSEKPAEVISFLNKWLPAHLAYGVTYEKFLEAENFMACIWQHDEIFTLCEVKI